MNRRNNIIRANRDRSLRDRPNNAVLSWSTFALAVLTFGLFLFNAPLFQNARNQFTATVDPSLHVTVTNDSIQLSNVGAVDISRIDIHEILYYFDSKYNPKMRTNMNHPIYTMQGLRQNESHRIPLKRVLHPEMVWMKSQWASAYISLTIVYRRAIDDKLYIVSDLLRSILLQPLCHSFNKMDTVGAFLCMELVALSRLSRIMKRYFLVLLNPLQNSLATA